MSVIRYLHYIYDFSDLWLLESRGYGYISYEAGKYVIFPMPRHIWGPGGCDIMKMSKIRYV